MDDKGTTIPVGSLHKNNIGLDIEGSAFTGDEAGGRVKISDLSAVRDDSPLKKGPIKPEEFYILLSTMLGQYQRMTRSGHPHGRPRQLAQTADARGLTMDRSEIGGLVLGSVDSGDDKYHGFFKYDPRTSHLDLISSISPEALHGIKQSIGSRLNFNAVNFEKSVIIYAPPVPPAVLAGATPDEANRRTSEFLHKMYEKLGERYVVVMLKAHMMGIAPMSSGLYSQEDRRNLSKAVGLDELLPNSTPLAIVAFGYLQNPPKR